MAIAVAVMGAFLVIVGQLWYLQVLEGGHFLDASDKNRIRIRPVAAPRGILFDKNGVPLVDNRPAFTLSLIPRELPREDQSRDAVLGRVASLLQIPYQELEESVARVPSDSFLPVRVRPHTDPHPGSQVITTIDRRIQEAAEQAMEGKAGAVVVMDPRSGDIRALVSTPAFEIDRFTGTIDRAAWLRVVQDPEHPLLNRAIQSQYAPGSIFKIVVTAAGLQEASLTPMDRVYCNGEFHLGAWTFKDWKQGGHGSVDLQRALAQSCNIFYYQAGLKIGGAAITKYARAFGFGTATGVELGGEKLGLIPQPKGRRKAWQGGDIVNMSIGQGQVLVTPLQVARFMAAVANGGVLWKPRLVERIERADRGVLYSDPGQVAGHVELSPAVWAFLRQALWAVVNDGTGIAAKIPGIDIAGKTGTAQMIAHSKAEKGQDHAWFAIICA